MKNIVAALLALTFVGTSAVMAAESGKEVKTTTDTKVTPKKAGGKAHHKHTVVDKKKDVKTEGNKTTTEDSTKTTTEAK